MMENKKVTRREFMRDSAVVAAGVAAGLGTGLCRTTEAAPPKTVDTSKILNYNPNMLYRRQGKTNLMVSAVCLGGHSRSNVEQRTKIVSRCIDAGINYIDACTRGEVIRDAKALKGRRDKMYLSLLAAGRADQCRGQNEYEDTIPHIFYLCLNKGDGACAPSQRFN